MRHAALLVCCPLLASLVACSGGRGSSGAPEAAPVQPAVSELAATPADATPSPSPSSVIAAVLDSRPMAMYLHPEVEGRVPVRVAGPALAGVTVDAVAQGQPVELLTVVEATTDPEGPCVFFERIDIGEATAEVELRYPIEGVIGRFVLEREGAGWRIVKAELAER